MAHIHLPEGVPGIVGPMMAYPETESHLNGLAEALLRGPSSLTPAEREIIATYVSAENDCYFCMNAHAAAARYLLGSECEVVDQVIVGAQNAPLSPKLKALLVIAEKVRKGGRQVMDEDIAHARAEGADDKAIHDTVLISAAFCMFNRYVDGLATWAPEDPAVYAHIGAKLGETGYTHSIR